MSVLLENTPLVKFIRNFRKMFDNVRVTFGQVFTNLRESSESGRKSSENRQKRRHQDVYIIKRALHVSSKIWFYVLVARTTSHSFAALTWEILFLPLKHKIHIFSPLCNILYLFWCHFSGQHRLPNIYATSSLFGANNMEIKFNISQEEQVNPGHSTSLLKMRFHTWRFCRF